MRTISGDAESGKLGKIQVCVAVNEQFEPTVIVVQRSAGAPSVVNGTSFWRWPT